MRAVGRRFARLRVFRIPILRGRDINQHDGAGSTPVSLIGQALARQSFPNQDPVGQRIEIGREDCLLDIRTSLENAT